MTTIEIKLPDVKLGIVESDQVRVGPADSQLANLMEQVCDRKRAGLTTEALAEAEPMRAVRTMFRAWGMDPSKYRPSSEALLRRVVQGKELYKVSNVVDIGNLGSIETGWPLDVTTALSFVHRSRSAMAPRAKSMKELASGYGIWRGGQFSPTPTGHLAVQSAIQHGA